MSFPFGGFLNIGCSHKFPNIEKGLEKKLGKKRCGDFIDPQKYSKYKSTPFPKLGMEKHIPGYNYCGPGTQVEQRLVRGDYGINKLDNVNF